MTDRFVGRGEELALLSGLVAGLSAGVGGVVLVEGEQGIGKSSLLRAGVAGAEAPRCRVLWGAADELGQRFPLRLMMECIGRAAGPEQVGELLTGRGGAMSGDPVLAGVERLLAMVDRLCAESPVVLVAEDLQWADEASVLVWARLAQAVGQLPLLLAGSWRPGTGRADLEKHGHFALLARAILAERAGGYTGVIATLSVAIDPATAPEFTARYFLLPVLARAARELADEVTLAATAAAAQQDAEHGQLPVRAAIADQCRGLLTGDPGPVLAAADYFGAAGRTLDHGRALEDAAALAARRGDLAAARRTLAPALAAYQALGAEWDIRRAGARLRPFGIHGRRTAYQRRPVSGWNALTPTEAKVAGLVAGGKSNPDIAAELFLSRNTVQTHVSHILTKLSARSRVEIVTRSAEAQVSA